MAIGSNTRGIRAQMGIAFDIPVPAGRAPDDEQGGKDSAYHAKRPLSFVSEAVGYRRDDECRDKNACRNVPKGHFGIMALFTMTFKVA